MSTFEPKLKDGIFPSLTNEELEALDNLDQSIRFHETFSDSEERETKESEDDFEDTCSELSDDNSLTFTIPQMYNQFKLPVIPESYETSTDFVERKESKSDKINAGYILFDGSEIKYVNYKETGTMDSVRATSVSSDRFSSIKSRASTTTQTSDSIPINLYISADDLLGQDFLKNAQGFSLAPYSRLPTNSHFSLREKLYFFLIGLACVISFNSIYISVAFFRGVLGDQVLQILGSCHYASLLVAMAMVFLGKKTWFQFIPTIIVSFVLMAGVVAVFPVLSVLSVTCPHYVIYMLVSLNGLCTGLALATVDRMVFLFPGGKSSLLFRLGGGFGCILPSIIQMTAILIDFKEDNLSELKESNAFNLYIVFPVAFLGIFFGFISAIKLSRSGIYGLFADSENSFDNPRWVTISSSVTTVIKRCKRLAFLLLAEFIVAAVTWYCLSVAQIVHLKTLEHNSSNKSPFWEEHQTTVLIGIFQFGDVIGSLLGSLWRCCCKSLAKKFLSGLHLLLSLLRIGCVIAIAYFIRSPYLVHNNIFIMGLYFLLAITNGFLLVGMANQSSPLCELQIKDSCPIISQITWLAIQSGCLVGVGFSFLPFS
ncbi:uncharacterized protein LOC116299850 [Actinia tenebrosa]|uniref:Uncharacterized protein LOC116299850 n=1 Tax=Actinia tenebrosa TaxID=6105 RepID=A0A6P8IEM8_ACTTE|nr:uncharacterized protein LOC116299850 [Actinia tenebrosa]